MINNIFKTLLSLSISGGFIALILIALKPFFKNKFSNTWYYYIWLIVILRLTIPYSPSIDIYNLKNKTSNIIVTNENKKVDMNLNFEVTNKEIPNTFNNLNLYIEKTLFSKQFQYYNYISYIWLIICIFLSIKKIINYYSFIKFIKRNSKPIVDDTIINIHINICKSLNTKQIPIYFNDIIISPMLVGFFKPYILLPQKQLQNISQLNYVLKHELTHYKYLDIYYKWFVQFIMCIYWFNPVIYLINKEINRYCELSCDELVIRNLEFIEQREYGNTLINSLEINSNYNNISLNLTQNLKLMKERLDDIMKFQKKSKPTIFLSVLITIILCIGTAFIKISNKYNNIEQINSIIEKVEANEVNNDLVPMPISNITEDEIQKYKAFIEEFQFYSQQGNSLHKLENVSITFHNNQIIIEDSSGTKKFSKEQLEAILEMQKNIENRMKKNEIELSSIAITTSSSGLSISNNLNLTATNCDIIIEKSDRFKYEYDKALFNIDTKLSNGGNSIKINATSKLTNKPKEIIKIFIPDSFYKDFNIVSNHSNIDICEVNANININSTKGNINCYIPKDFNKNMSYNVDKGSGSINFNKMADNYTVDFLNYKKLFGKKIILDEYTNSKGNGLSKINIKLSSSNINIKEY